MKGIMGFMLAAGLSAQLISTANEPAVETQKQQVQEVDQMDRQLLAHVIYGEARGCSEKCQRYVGSVVLNRVKSDLYPDTMEEVVYQTSPALQYGCTVSAVFDEEPNKLAYEIADELIRYGSILPENVVFQSEYVQGKIYEEIDGVYFCEVSKCSR